MRLFDDTRELSDLTLQYDAVLYTMLLAARTQKDKT